VALAAMLALAGAMLAGNARSTPYLMLLLGGASLMLVLVALRARAPAAVARDQPLVETAQRRGVLCLLALPGVIWLAGLPIALAALVLGWQPAPPDSDSHRSSPRWQISLRRIVAAVAVGVASHYLAHEVFHLLLPRGRLFDD
jgi:hypothetical protein